MKIERVCIEEENNSVVEFAHVHTEKAIILIKNERLAKRLKKEIKKLELEEITYGENKKIFLLKSIGTKYIRPEIVEEALEVYYIYSLNRDYCIDNPIVETISDEQLIHFLETHSDRKWKIFSRRMYEGILYVTLKPKWAKGKACEWMLLDTCSPITNINYDMDYEWKNYIFNTLLKPTLEQYMN